MSLLSDGSAVSSNQRRKKICMVSYVWRASNLPPMYHEGIFFANAGIDVEVICVTMIPDRPKLETIVTGFKQKRIFLHTRRFVFKLFGQQPSTNFGAAFRYLSTYFEYVVKAFLVALKSKADVYEAHDLPTLLPSILVAKLCHKPVVYNAHELYADMNETVRFAGFWRFLERAMVPFVKAVIVPEENRAEIIYRESHPKIFPLIVQNYPPSKEPMNSTKLRNELTVRGIKAETIVLYQGLIHTSRCIEELVVSTNHFGDGIVLVVIGSGYDEYADPNKIMKQSDKVLVLQQVPYDELLPYTASADIGILFYRNTCRNNYYCAPNKLYEYMMMGLPIVTCDYPGLKKIVEGEQVGLCVNPEKPLEIAKAINILATDHELYQKMRANCLRLSRERNNWENEFKKLFDLYADILALPSSLHESS
jgi:glycosyltransferase involved in cell wall biosynthesis